MAQNSFETCKSWTCDTCKETQICDVDKHGQMPPCVCKASSNFRFHMRRQPSITKRKRSPHGPSDSSNILSSSGNASHVKLKARARDRLHLYSCSTLNKLGTRCFAKRKRHEHRRGALKAHGETCPQSLSGKEVLTDHQTALIYCHHRATGFSMSYIRATCIAIHAKTKDWSYMHFVK